MSRLIDADRLKAYWQPDHDRTFVADYFIHSIDAQPSAEPQIIRCKDCKYHNYWRECRKINGLTDAHKTLCTDDSFYCGFAERMEVTE